MQENIVQRRQSCGKGTTNITNSVANNKELKIFF